MVNMNIKTDKTKYSKELTKEIESIIKKENLNCSIHEFQDKVDWYWISYKQKLSEEFIEKFQDKIDWRGISYSQKLSDGFIEKFKLYITKFKIKFKRKLHHGKYFYGTKKTPIRREFFINNKLYGEQNKYENR